MKEMQDDIFSQYRLPAISNIGHYSMWVSFYRTVHQEDTIEHEIHKEYGIRLKYSSNNTQPLIIALMFDITMS